MEQLNHDDNGASDSQCLHLSFINKKCTKCSKSHMECGNPATLPFRYLQPNLALTVQEIIHRRDDNFQSLMSRKKLQLVLDLDHTLVHARSVHVLTPEETARIETMDDLHYMFFGTYVVKLRPGAREFLEQVSSMFDLSVFTLADEDHARAVVSLLDSGNGPSRFSWVISKEDSMKRYKKGLDIVLSHENVVLIIDDTVDVWDESGSQNLIKITPYHFVPMQDESKVMDEELTRVLLILKAVHTLFFDGNGVDYSRRDVRHFLKRVLRYSTRSWMQNAL